ncbi:hypothetical protein COCNU_scaffold028333G000010 [Cocos nucifera]|nr:hypothetical protein [Cocos nucifera]
MASSVRLLPPMESVSAGRPEKKKKLMSEGSDEEYGKSVGEGSEEEKMDSSVCPCGNCYCGMTEEEKQYKDTLNGLFDCEGEPEEDSDGDMMVGGIVAYLRGKFDLEGPDAEDWRRMAD